MMKNPGIYLGAGALALVLLSPVGVSAVPHQDGNAVMVAYRDDHRDRPKDMREDRKDQKKEWREDRKDHRDEMRDRDKKWERKGDRPGRPDRRSDFGEHRGDRPDHRPDMGGDRPRPDHRPDGAPLGGRGDRPNPDHRPDARDHR